MKYRNCCENLMLLIMGLGSEDVVAEYYQQQGEMLEGFNEMDALAERGLLPGISKVCMICVLFCCSFVLLSYVMNYFVSLIYVMNYLVCAEHHS